MPAAKSSENPGVLIPADTELNSPRNAGRVRLAKALATKPAATIPGMTALLTKAKKPTSNRVKLSENDYAQLTTLKQRLQTLGTNVKRSQLLRAGLALLVAMNDIELARTVAQVGVIKPRSQPQRAS